MEKEKEVPLKSPEVAEVKPETAKVEAPAQQYTRKEFQAIIELYRIQNPTKAAMKEAEFARILATLK